MTPRKVAALLSLWALLSAYYFVFEREPVAEPLPEQAAPPSVIDVPASRVSAIEVRSPGRAIRATRSGSSWTVEGTAGRVTGDLVEALLASLCEAPVVQVVGTARGAMADFGLDPPSVVISLRLQERDGETTIELGERNPARTAVYARVRGKDEVVLVGLNTRYYAELLLAAAPGQQGTA